MTYQEALKEYRNEQASKKTQKRSKYGNKKTEVDNVVFDSKAEATRYNQLKLLERGREIRGLVLQPRFPIEVNGQKVCTYVGDFSYTNSYTGEFFVEDTKGMKTPMYNLKKKLMKAVYNIDIIET